MKHLLSFTLVAALATPALAQEPRHDQHEHDQRKSSHMEQMERMMAPMMSAMAFAPDHLLSRKDSIGLSAQQIARLTALRDAAKTPHDAAAADAKTHMTAMADGMRAAAPDTAAIKGHFEAAHAAMGKAHWAMLSAATQARAVLTDEQRGRVERWATRMNHRSDDH